MSAFLTSLHLEDDGDGRIMRLLAPLVYASDRLRQVVTVPTGFETDFASIPSVVWWVLPPHGPYDRPAVVHDSLYQAGGVTRGDADAVLTEAMIVCQVPRWRRLLITAGVRSGGWSAWARYRREDAILAAHWP